MLHYVHQQVCNFGADQVACSQFKELFCLKRLPAAAKKDAIRALRVNQNSKVAGWTA